MLSVRCNAGPAEGPGKILKYRSNLRLYPVNFSNKLCFLMFIILSIWPNFFDPPFTTENFLVPPFWQLKTFLAPPLHFAQPPHQSIYEHSLKIQGYYKNHWTNTRLACTHWNSIFIAFYGELKYGNENLSVEIFWKSWKTFDSFMLLACRVSHMVRVNNIPTSWSEQDKAVLVILIQCFQWWSVSCTKKKITSIYLWILQVISRITSYNWTNTRLVLIQMHFFMPESKFGNENLNIRIFL